MRTSEALTPATYYVFQSGHSHVRLPKTLEVPVTHLTGMPGLAHHSAPAGRAPTTETSGSSQPPAG